MEPNRYKIIGRHVIEEFYWNGRFVVYVDHKLTDKGFEQAIQDQGLYESNWGNTTESS